jgi:hypothetical protein
MTNLINVGDTIKRQYGTFEIKKIISETDKTWELDGLSKSKCGHGQREIIRIRKSSKISFIK